MAPPKKATSEWPLWGLEGDEALDTATFAVNAGSFDVGRYRFAEVNAEELSSTESSLTLASEDYSYQLTGKDFSSAGPEGLPTGGTVYTIEATSEESSWTLIELGGLPLKDVLAFMQAGDTEALLETAFSGNDVLTGGTKNDYLKGGAGADGVTGGPGDDEVDGGAGSDRLIGGDGADRLIGGAGNDTCFGGEGKDLFVIAKGDGPTNIYGFQDGYDKIGLAADLSFAELNIQSSDIPAIAPVTLIKVAGEELARLEDVAVSNVTADDFILI